MSSRTRRRVSAAVLLRYATENAAAHGRAVAVAADLRMALAVADERAPRSSTEAAASTEVCPGCCGVVARTLRQRGAGATLQRSRVLRLIDCQSERVPAERSRGRSRIRAARTFVGFAFWVVKEVLWTLLSSFSTGAAILVFLPGLLTKAGIREVVATATGARVTYPGFPSEFQGNPSVTGPPRAELVTRLVPSVMLALIGFAFVVPTLVRMSLLGVLPFADLVDGVGLDGQPGISGGDVYASAVVGGSTEAVVLWCGLTCWFCAAPRHASVRRTRELLAAERQWLLRGFCRALLAPAQGVARITEVVDRLAVWLGAHVLVAGGTLYAVGMFVVATMAIMALVG